MKTIQNNHPLRPRLARHLIGFTAAALWSIGTAHAVVSTWTGGAGTGTSSYTLTNNWQSGVTFGAGNSLYFSSGTASNFIVQVSGTRVIDALVFGAETTGTSAISVIGNNNTLTINGVQGSTLGLTGDLASATVGLWVQSGAGANGLYANNTGGGNIPTKSQVGVPILINTASTTFINESGSDFYLDARLRGTTGGSLILRKGSWVIDYTQLNGSNGTSQLNGGLTIEDAKLTVNVSGGTTGGNSDSPLANGTFNLGLAGSSKDATFVFTAIERSGSSASNRLSVTSGNLVNVADGTGKRVIQNGSAAKKELYTSLTIGGSATLALDNNHINGAVFEISADAVGVSAANDLLTGVRGTGNLYLTGSGTFYTKAGLVTGTNGVRNSFTGSTTVHDGTLQFRDSGGFQKSSLIQIDKNGILDVSQATGGTYLIGDPTYLSGTNTQTLAGTGQVAGTILLGSQSVLRAGGTDSGGSRAALTFAQNLALGPLTIADLTSGYYGAVDTQGILTYGGELRLTLATGYSASGSYNLFDFSSLNTGDFGSVTVYSGTTQIGSLILGTGGIWSNTLSGQTYTFTQSDGILAVPEPSTVALLVIAGFFVLARARRGLRAAKT